MWMPHGRRGLRTGAALTLNAQSRLQNRWLRWAGPDVVLLFRNARGPAVAQILGERCRSSAGHRARIAPAAPLVFRLHAAVWRDYTAR